MASGEARAPASPASPAAQRGLDGLNLFVANIQTGFGPFIAVYLTTEGWTQTAIGMALSLGTLTAMASQIPAGAVVDAIENKSRVAGFSLLAFTFSALLLAINPIPLLVYGAEILHGFASCTLGPAIAAITVGVCGGYGLSVRFGRNARYASIGNGIGAALMAACGYYISERAVFFLTAALTLPALLLLIPLSGVTLPVEEPPPEAPARWKRFARVLNRRLLIFSACAVLFFLSGAAMLPLASGALTQRAGSAASLMIGASIVLPQAVVALLSPWIGRLCRARGRRIAMLLGFAMVPLRGLVLAASTDPVVVILVQALDGVSAACWGVLQPLVTSDIAGRSGHYNLSLGVVGFAIGIGATLSTTLGGWSADHFGAPAAFAILAGIGLLGLLLVWVAMPETRPARQDPQPSRSAA